MVRQTSFGYTLVELMVTLTIVGIMAMIAFIGVGSYRQGDFLVNAQQEFISNLRALQNKVDNGADSESVKSLDLPLSGTTATSYKVQITAGNRRIVTLPSGVYLSAYYTPSFPSNLPYAGPLSFCFSNRYLTNFDNVNNQCGPNVPPPSPCTDPTLPLGYVCDQSSGLPTAINPVTLVVQFKLLNNAAMSREVVVEGTGGRINRIYAR